MRYNFRNVKILVVDNFDSNRRMLVGILEVLGAGAVHGVRDAAEGFTSFQKNSHDIVIAELRDGNDDAVALAKKIRTLDIKVPILAVAGPRSLAHVEAARKAGISDLLQSPYSADDMANRLAFLLGDGAKNPDGKDAAPPAKKPAAESWPPEEESFALTHLLLDHYTKHHEIVVSKLKFAHSATKKCIDEIRVTHKKVKSKDNVNVLEFSDFNQMWEDIITMFMHGGLSEDDISEIEKLITKMPGEIKNHYDDLSQQDKSFLTLVESLNRDAYRKAKDRVMKLQAQPNPLNGRTSEHYAPPPRGTSMEAFFFET